MPSLQVVGQVEGVWVGAVFQAIRHAFSHVLNSHVTLHKGRRAVHDIVDGVTKVLAAVIAAHQGLMDLFCE